MKIASSWEWEQKAKAHGYIKIAGLDEVGRGAWAGPIVAATYLFFTVPTEIELFDSKLLNYRKRELLKTSLIELGLFGIGEATAHEIDTLGLQEAQYLAYRRALDRLPIVPDIVLLDGRAWHSCPVYHEAIIDGDAKVASIAAASIIAKQYRDGLMQTRLHQDHPDYGFDKHVGYGTKQHQEAIKRLGVLPVHRQSYKPIQQLLK